MPGSVWCEVAARADLEAVVGPVSTLAILGTVRRARPDMLHAVGEPEPLAVPIAVHAPFHVIDIDEAWAFAGHDTVRWTLATGQRTVLPVLTAAEFQLALRSRGRPTAFARASP